MLHLINQKKKTCGNVITLHLLCIEIEYYCVTNTISVVELYALELIIELCISYNNITFSSKIHLKPTVNI